MTYGWAILIIAVVLGVLFQLGVFSGSALAPRAQPGSCTVQRFAGQVSLEGLCQGQLPEFVGQFDGNLGTAISATVSSAATPTQGTAAIWVNRAWDTNNGATYGILGIGGYQSNPYDYNTIQVFKYATNYWYFRAWSISATCDVYVPDSVITGGTWHQIVMSWGSAVGGLSVQVDDGTPYTCGQAAFAPAFALPKIYVGTSWGAFQMMGSLANLQVYNTTLSSNEIKALYLEGIGGAPIRIQNLAAWYPLNGNGNDYSGYNNNGQVTGSGVSFNNTWSSSYTPP